MWLHNRRHNSTSMTNFKITYLCLKTHKGVVITISTQIEMLIICKFQTYRKSKLFKEVSFNKLFWRSRVWPQQPTVYPLWGSDTTWDQQTQSRRWADGRCHQALKCGNSGSNKYTHKPRDFDITPWNFLAFPTEWSSTIAWPSRLSTQYYNIFTLHSVTMLSVSIKCVL